MFAVSFSSMRVKANDTYHTGERKVALREILLGRCSQDQTRFLPLAFVLFLSYPPPLPIGVLLAGIEPAAQASEARGLSISLQERFPCATIVSPFPLGDVKVMFLFRGGIFLSSIWLRYPTKLHEEFQKLHA